MTMNDSLSRETGTQQMTTANRMVKPATRNPQTLFFFFVNFLFFTKNIPTFAPEIFFT